MRPVLPVAAFHDTRSNSSCIDTLEGAARFRRAAPSTALDFAPFRARGQNPVAANQAPVGLVTNTIGAMHGAGRLTTSSISESPSGEAGNVFVERLTVAATRAPVPSTIGVRQLTNALNAAVGLGPAPPPPPRTKPRPRPP